MVDAVVAAVGLVKPYGITSIQIQFFKCFPKHAIRSTIIKSDSDCTAFTFLYVFYFHICSIFKISGDRYSCNSNLRIGTRQSRCLASISCLFSSTHVKVPLVFLLCSCHKEKNRIILPFSFFFWIFSNSQKTLVTLKGNTMNKHHPIQTFIFSLPILIVRNCSYE